jgi:hypothetical protein
LQACALDIGPPRGIVAGDDRRCLPRVQRCGSKRTVTLSNNELPMMQTPSTGATGWKCG